MAHFLPFPGAVLFTFNYWATLLILGKQYLNQLWVEIVTLIGHFSNIREGSALSYLLPQLSCSSLLQRWEKLELVEAVCRNKPHYKSVNMYSNENFNYVNIQVGYESLPNGTFDSLFS